MALEPKAEKRPGVEMAEVAVVVALHDTRVKKHELLYSAMRASGGCLTLGCRPYMKYVLEAQD